MECFFFFIPARILITSGMPKENGQNTEIIDLINPDFECELLANIPARSAAVGGFLQNHPLICGGKDDAWNCFQVKIKKKVRFWTFLNMSIFSGWYYFWKTIWNNMPVDPNDGEKSSSFICRNQCNKTLE